jgi:hypothetical protein
MAGVKVTDLTTLPAAASDDVMYIVDTSSNTSKQIEVQNIYNGMPQLESGSYTPVASNAINSASINTTIGDGYYIKVGNVVIFTVTIGVQMDAAESQTEFNLSLPVSTTFSSLRQAWGSCNVDSDRLRYFQVQSDSTTTTTDLLVRVDSVNNGDEIQILTITAQYLVL